MGIAGEPDCADAVVVKLRNRRLGLFHSPRLPPWAIC
jgi:hypothetical protein